MSRYRLFFIASSSLLPSCICSFFGQVVYFSSNRGLISTMQSTPWGSKFFNKYKMDPTKAFSCLFNFLFELRPHLQEKISPLYQKLVRRSHTTYCLQVTAKRKLVVFFMIITDYYLVVRSEWETILTKRIRICVKRKLRIVTSSSLPVTFSVLAKSRYKKYLE
jgi:hypothetical protein